ncbi:restriction endonuclease subunit S [Alkalibacterium sp. 20]|uniref:restriction endonuclease subunit S n=1 Tax=Alkalibacterium sp. 20 TaxID=1798803 RepID=UPI0009002E6B|nr:restriction endonuclease subunit S [Alkalibacterium sp. 20]
MNKEKLTPNIRFGGFNADWKKCNLGDGAVRIGDGLHGTPQYSETGKVAFINGNNLVNGKIIITKKTKFVQEEQQSKKDKLLNNDTILISINGTIGNLAYYAGENVMLGKSTSFLEVTKFDKKFMYQLLQTNKIKNYFFSNLTGSTIKNLGLNTIRETPCFVPLSEEQIKLGLFFSKMDNIITLEQQLLKDHKQLKKAMLQKMFPQKGETVPRVRFAGFTDNWEQRKLSELASHRGGTAIEKHFSESGKYKVISIGSYGTESKYVDQGIRVMSNEVTSKRIVRKNELTMVLNDKTANGTIIGRSLLIESDDEFIINQRTEIISPKNLFDPKFAYVVLNHPFREKVKKIVQGGTQIYVNYSAVENLTITIPLKEEQEKIGDFFKQLDETINLHQKKLETYQELKKAMLQKMFV